MNIRILSPLAVSALALLFAGCGPGSNSLAPANVSGSVTKGGKPLPGGTIGFVTPDGNTYSTDIGADGTYSIKDLPDGELVVIVETESVNPDRKGESGGKDKGRRESVAQQQPPSGYPPSGGTTSGLGGDKKYVPINKKYASHKTSPLTHTLKSGRNVYTAEVD
jgi:hypothetical protein